MAEITNLSIEYQTLFYAPEPNNLSAKNLSIEYDAIPYAPDKDAIFLNNLSFEYNFQPIDEPMDLFPKECVSENFLIPITAHNNFMAEVSYNDTPPTSLSFSGLQILFETYSNDFFVNVNNGIYSPSGNGGDANLVRRVTSSMANSLVFNFGLPGTPDTGGKRYITIGGRYENLSMTTLTDANIVIKKFGKLKPKTFMLRNFDNLTIEDHDNFDFSTIVNLFNSFRGNKVINWNLSNPIDLPNCTSLSNTFMDSEIINGHIKLNLINNVTLGLTFFRSGIKTTTLNFGSGVYNLSSTFIECTEIENVTLNFQDGAEVNFGSSFTYIHKTIPNFTVTGKIKVTNANNMFKSTEGFTTADYNAFLILLDHAEQNSNITANFGTSVPTGAGLVAKNNLINNKNWTIIDSL